MSKKLHNPKSFAPAVYIPCWLIQISIKLLSHGAKILYGRLSQWSNEKGQVFRSCAQLAEELGCSIRTIEYLLKELKDNFLIGTFHPQAGGINHFEFYDHPWMHEPINEHLVYKDDKRTPPQDFAVPPARFCGTPPQDLADINIKEIKTNKNTTTTGDCAKKEPSEPHSVVVVDISSKTLTEREQSLLSSSYRDNPFHSQNIKNEEDFLKAALYSLLNRDNNISRSQRLHGIRKLLGQGLFEEPNGWAKSKSNSSSFKNQKNPDEYDFKFYKQKKSGYEWVGKWIDDQYHYNRLDQEYFQLHGAKRIGYEWVGEWLKAKGYLNKKQN